MPPHYVVKEADLLACGCHIEYYRTLELLMLLGSTVSPESCCICGFCGYCSDFLLAQPLIMFSALPCGCCHSNCGTTFTFLWYVTRRSAALAPMAAANLDTCLAFVCLFWWRLVATTATWAARHKLLHF